jgi:trigger factor
LSNKTEQFQTIKTEHLNVALTHQSGCQVKLEINVSPEATKAAYAKAVKAINKEISIPGFRKGKSPEALVVQRFASPVNKEWHDILLNTSFNEFLAQTHLYPYTSVEKSLKRAEVKNASKENGAQLVFEYEANPSIPEVDVSSIQLKRISEDEVTPEAIEETIHQVQLKLGSWDTVTDRPVQEGDFVDLDIEALENPPRSVCQDMRFEVVPGRMGTWMRKLIVGKSINDTVEGMSEKEESLISSSDEDFLPTLCRITIKGIKVATLPPLDDELAKKVGLKAIEELKPKIEEDLERQAEDEKKDQLRAQVEKQLLEKYVFDIPASLIAKHINNITAQKLQELRKHEHSQDHLKSMAKEIETNAFVDLNRAYRLYFLTHKIAEEHQIGVFENELMSEMFKQMMLPEGQGIVNKQMSTEEVRSKLYVNVLSKKVLDFLVEKATYIDSENHLSYDPTTPS